MPPELAKLLQSLAGVFFVFGLVYWLFPKSKKLDRERVESDFTRCYPETDIQDIILSDDFKTAVILINNHSGDIGVTKVLGDRTVTKLFTANDIKTIELKPNAFHLHVNDFTFPPVKIGVSPKNLEALSTYCTTSKNVACKVKTYAL